MSLFHCLCGFANDDPDEFGDHFRLAFMRDDDTGTDGTDHAEITSPGDPRNICSCGFASSDPRDLDDHFLLVFTPPDAIGTDGHKHIPADLASAERFRVTGSAG
jgi:hypothetical protein